MIERTQHRFDLWPARLAADSAYGSAEILAWLVHERGIEAHIPVFDKSERQDATFSRSKFTYDHGQYAYVCPPARCLLLATSLPSSASFPFAARSSVFANRRPASTVLCSW